MYSGLALRQRSSSSDRLARCSSSPTGTFPVFQPAPCQRFSRNGQLAGLAPSDIRRLRTTPAERTIFPTPHSSRARRFFPPGILLGASTQDGSPLLCARKQDR